MKKSYISNNSYFLIFSLLLFIFLIGNIPVIAQVELVPVGNPVYDFLKRMQLEGFIPEYNSSNTPVSRAEVADYLKVIKSNSSNFATIDKNLLNDYYIEFGYDINKSLSNATSFLGKDRNNNIFDDKKQKYLFAYSDSIVSFFFDGRGALTHRSSAGDSLGSNTVVLGWLGFRMRGTFFNTLGFYMNPTGGKRFKGEKKDSEFAQKTDPYFFASNHFNEDGKTFDFFEGYLRYQTNSRWLAVTLGREVINQGFGYTDKMYFSNNTVPFDYVRLDLSYKILKYSFLYGALKGDSLGHDITYKNISTQRLDVQFSKSFRMGFWEAIVIPDNAFSFTYLNPLSFLFSADINASVEQTYKNSALFAVDFEAIPIKNLAVQGTILVDDINFDTFYKNDSTANDNKLGYQVGLMWNKAFTLPGMSLALEYTKVDPFTYSHRSNKSQYTNWSMPMGPILPPNGDEIAAKIIYNFTNRLRLDLLYQHQRSAEGVEFDSTGKVITNYGGYINRGEGEFLKHNIFLNGNRINRDILTLNLRFEPIRQYFFEIKYQYKYQNLLYLNKKIKDHIFFLTFRLDY
ncbi:MAG: hypothetical protein NTU73_03835 [Ignavibacteriae bacterium]|nr:hypothetical protein [Ignavibacteriota bacterium]